MEHRMESVSFNNGEDGVDCVAQRSHGGSNRRPIFFWARRRAAIVRIMMTPSEAEQLACLLIRMADMARKNGS